MRLPIEGRLQTGEHILARIIQNKYRDAKVVIAKFSEKEGSLDISTSLDLRNLSIKEIENEVNIIINKGLNVTKKIFERKDVEKDFDLEKIPEVVREIRIVEIENFDKRPCRDPHVDNTNEIGTFRIKSIKREGKDRYRLVFFLDEPPTIN